MRVVVSVAVGVWLLAVSTAARADRNAVVPDHELGEPWQYLLTSDSHVEVEEDRGGDSSKQFSMLIRLAVDRVMPRQLTIGGHASLESEEGGSVEVLGFFGGIRAGWLRSLDASNRFYVWARTGLSYGSFTYTFESGGQATVASLRGEVSCPILYAITGRLVIGLGPFLEHELFSGVGRDDPIPKVTTIGVQGLIGGWFHGQ